MNELTAARQIIDECDREMAALFERRLEAVKSIALYKQEHGLPVYVPEREKAVLEKNAALIQAPWVRPYYLQFLQQLMDLSKRCQEKLISGEEEEQN